MSSGAAVPGRPPADDAARAARYERQCRRLLRAFPSDFRRDRGEELVGTLLDDAPGAGHVSLGTAVDLVAAGTRMRARRAGADGTLRRSVSGGSDLVAAVALGLQAALLVTGTVHFLVHEGVFEAEARSAGHGGVPGFVSGGPVGHWVAGGAWIALSGLAVTATAALVSVVRGRLPCGALLSVVATAGSVLLVGVSDGPAGALSHPQLFELGGGISQVDGPQFEFLSSPAVLAIGVIATAAALTASRRRRPPVVRHTWGWLAGEAVLVLVLLAVVAGRDLSGFAPFAPLRQGGVPVALDYLWVAGTVVALAWSRVDPRAGWVAVALTPPFVVLQLQPGPASSFDHAVHVLLALAAAGIAVRALTVNATYARRRLQTG